MHCTVHRYIHTLVPWKKGFIDLDCSLMTDGIRVEDIWLPQGRCRHHGHLSKVVSRASLALSLAARGHCRSAGIPSSIPQFEAGEGKPNVMLAAIAPCSAPGSKLASTIPARLAFALRPLRFKAPVMSCLMSNIPAFPLVVEFDEVKEVALTAPFGWRAGSGVTCAQSRLVWHVCPHGIPATKQR